MAKTLFLNQCEMRQGLLCEAGMPTPNGETCRALEEAHAGIGIISHEKVADMFREWEE